MKQIKRTNVKFKGGGTSSYHPRMLLKAVVFGSSERLKGVLKQVFGQVVELLVSEGLVNLQEVYTDGTKIESKANRYTFV